MDATNSASERTHGIGRRRDRQLVDALLKAAARRGGRIDETACFEAVSSVHQNGVTPSSAVSIVRRKLTDPNIAAALSAVVGNPL